VNRARQNISAQLCYFSSVNVGGSQVESRNQQQALDNFAFKYCHKQF